MKALKQESAANALPALEACPRLNPHSSRFKPSPYLGSFQEPRRSSITSVEFHECRAVLAYLSRSECREKRDRFMLAQGAPSPSRAQWRRAPTPPYVHRYL